MKVTKEMLAEMRHNVAEPQGFSIHRGDLAELPVGLLEALLDERKALREALAYALPVPVGGAAAREALALGEDE